MELKFEAPHLSIKELDTIKLPDLTVIHGANGSGKTHLMLAIIDHNIVALEGEKRLRTAYISDFRDRDPVTPPGEAYYKSNQQAYDSLLKLATDSELTKKFLDRYTTIDQRNAYREYNPMKLISIAMANRDSGGQDAFLTSLIKAAQDRDKPGEVQNVNRIVAHCRSNSFKFTELTPQSLYNIVSDRTRSFLAPQSGVIFANYLRLHTEAVSHRLRNDGKDPDENFENDFVQQYGPPPWEVYNGQLEKFGLEHSFSKEQTRDGQNHEIVMRKDGALIKIDDVSSGERVMLNFVLATLGQSDTKATVETQDLILLDEPDAHLHPKLVRDLFERVLVPLTASGTKVILSTHSPTTIALAPENSIFEKVPGKGLVKSSKQSAINSLLVGVQHLAVDFSGRRQVISESKKDADLYGQMYKLMRPYIKCDRSLEFIGLGNDKEGGKGKVKKVVKDLRESGATTVFGLIDWDATETETDSIKVNGKNSHYSIENVLAAPIFVGLLLSKMREGPFATGSSYTDLKDFSANDFQSISDKVTEMLGATKPLDCQIIDLMNAATIQVPAEFMRMNGHEYLNLVTKKIPKVLSVSNNPSRCLMLAIVKQVFEDHPLVCPVSLCETFDRLLENQTQN